MELNRCFACGKETPPGFTIHPECEDLLKTHDPIEDIWVKQDALNGLGNFINLTPTLKAMSDHLGIKIPVYFELDFVRQCFIDCPFIQILDEMPVNKEYFSSSLKDYRNHVPDYIHAYRELCKRFNLPEPGHTYVDRCEEIKIDRDPYTLFMYGSGNEDVMYLHKKTPPKEAYEKYIEGNCVFTGSETDYKRWMFPDMEHHLGDIRYSLALIREATLIVTNDTGLAHAAGAMNKNMIILWRTTKLPKNSNPGKNTLIRMV